MPYDTTPQKDRNKFIIAHLVAGKSILEVRKLLVNTGYKKISPSRVWKIWNKADEYKEKRTRIKYCSFCLKNVITNHIKNVTENGVVVGRICQNCWADKPKQPINE